MNNKTTFFRKTLLTLVMSVACLLAYAQKTVTGQVKDQSGEPLIGVSIQVKGSTTGTITDFDGNFTMPDVEASDVLVFSYVGFTSQEVTVGNQSTINVTLSEDTETLEEVVVVGYGQMKKNDLTGSVSSVGTDAITARGTSGVVEALQGAVAGVNITQSSGRVGGGFDVEIRGKSSTNSDTKPIYVVDGIICDDIDFLNPSDISRIDVLKDASSTAIYGSRATAGVIMVTTKSGSNTGKKEAKPTISYDFYYGFSNPVRMNNFMTEEQFYNYRFAKFLTYAGGLANAINGSPSYQMGTFEQMALWNDDTQSSRLKEIMSGNDPKGMHSWNWPGMVTRNGMQQNHYVSVNGSSEHVAYHFGVGYNQEKGIYVGDEQRRINIKGSIDANINQYVQAGLNLNLSYMGNTYGNDDAVKFAFRMNPFMQPYNAEGELNEKPGNYQAMGSSSSYQFSDEPNPLLRLMNQTKQKETWRGLGNVYLQITPVKGLQIKSLFAPTYSSYRLGQFDDTIIDNETNISQKTNYTNFSYTWDNTITYDGTFADKHHLNIMALYSMMGGRTEKGMTQFTGVIDGTLWYNQGSGTYDAENSAPSSYSESSMMSAALRANYTYDGKYMITGTVRGDGSSKFAPGHKWGFFPSVAVAWRMSEEEWLQQAEWLTNLKWRLSYGVTGNNSGIGDYDTQQTVAGPVYYPFGLVYFPGFYPNKIIDSNLKWETSNEWNAGVDFGFLRDRITGTFDFYNKVSHDLLYPKELPLVAGGGTLVTNVGSVLNRGVEFGLKTVNIDTNGWYWETSFTLAHNHNEVLEINGSGTDKPGSTPTNGLFIGHSVNNIYGYDWTGIVTNQDMVVPNNDVAVANGFVPGSTVRQSDYYYACYGLVEGNPIIDDVNGDGKFTDEDKKIWSADPKLTGSLTSTLTWKGIEFAFTLYGKWGQKAYSNFYSEYLNYSDRGRQKIAMDYYIPAGTIINCDGVNPDGTYINPVYQEYTHYGSYPFPNNAGTNGGTNSSQWLENAKNIVDASYLKVKNITLAYSFQKPILQKLHIQRLRLYCTVTNPFVITGYKGFDPEWASAQLKNDAPSTINTQIGLNLKF